MSVFSKFNNSLIKLIVENDSNSTEPGKYFKDLGESILYTHINGPYGPWICTQYYPESQILEWRLNYPKQGQPSIELRFSNQKIYFGFFLPSSCRPISTGVFSFVYTLDIFKDQEKVCDFFDSISQQFENPDKYPIFKTLKRDDFSVHRNPPPEEISIKDAFRSKSETITDNQLLEPGWDKEPLPTKKKTWRDVTNEREIISLFPYTPKSDDVLDLYQKAKELRSNKLMNFAKNRAKHVRD